MTTDEASASIGRAVVYQGERGVITSVNARYVFVRYGADLVSKATDAGQLTLENEA